MKEGAQVTGAQVTSLSARWVTAIFLMPLFETIECEMSVVALTPVCAPT